MTQASVPLNALVSQELYDRLSTFTKQNRIPKAYVVRKAVEEYLNRTDTFTLETGVARTHYEP